MTTVLKALQDLERRELSAKPGALSTAVPEEPRRSSALVPALLAMACGALGVAGLLVARQGTGPTAPAAVSDASAPALAPVVQIQPQEVPPRAQTAVGGEAPWGRVERRAAPAAPAVERPPAPPVPAEARASKPRREVAQRPRRERRTAVEDDALEPAPVLVAPAPAVDAAPARAESPPVREAPALSTGAARVEVISIVYSSDVAHRTATLRINGGRPVVMHEGQSADGVDVQLILERSVYISNGGNVAEIGVGR